MLLLWLFSVKLVTLENFNIFETCAVFLAVLMLYWNMFFFQIIGPNYGNEPIYFIYNIHF